MANLSSYKLCTHTHLLAVKAGVDRVVFIIDENRAPDFIGVCSHLPRGAIVIFREYDHPERRKLAYQYCQISKAAGLMFFVARDPDLARSVGAAGVHLPEYQLYRRQRLFGLKVSASVHNQKSLRQANSLGVDFALISPVFKTRSHVGAKTLGCYTLSAYVRRSSLPLVALGGVNKRTTGMLRGIPLAGIAAIDGLIMNKS